MIKLFFTSAWAGSGLLLAATYSIPGSGANSSLR
jgi:hypothetical protein